MDKVQKLLERLYGDDVNKKTVKITSREKWAEKEGKKGVRIYDLDQE
jgi:hypothetical protein